MFYTKKNQKKKETSQKIFHEKWFFVSFTKKCAFTVQHVRIFFQFLGPSFGHGSQFFRDILKNKSIEYFVKKQKNNF